MVELPLTEELRRRLVVDPVREKLGEPSVPSVQELVGRVSAFHWETTSAPTATQRQAIDRAGRVIEPLMAEIGEVLTELRALSDQLDAAGGPWTPR